MEAWSTVIRWLENRNVDHWYFVGIYDREQQEAQDQQI